MRGTARRNFDTTLIQESSLLGQVLRKGDVPSKRRSQHSLPTADHLTVQKLLQVQGIVCQLL